MCGNMDVNEILNKIKEEISHGKVSHSEEDPVVGRDLFGYPYNKKYPADIKKYGNDYDGYPTPNRETFFFDFAVECYSVRFSYHGKSYAIQTSTDGPIQLDPYTYDILRKFPDNNALIEQMEIDGHKLIDIIDEVEDCEVY